MNKVDQIIQEYNKTRVETKRIRYPKIDLHPKFETVLDLQVKKLRRDGLSDKNIIDRLQRAIPFYVQDDQ